MLWKENQKMAFCPIWPPIAFHLFATFKRVINILEELCYCKL